jgi:hypothetical protein
MVPEWLHQEWVEWRLGPKPVCEHSVWWVEIPDWLMLGTRRIVGLPACRHDVCPGEAWKDRARELLAEVDSDKQTT